MRKFSAFVSLALLVPTLCQDCKECQNIQYETDFSNAKAPARYANCLRDVIIPEDQQTALQECKDKMKSGGGNSFNDTDWKSRDENDDKVRKCFLDKYNALDSDGSLKEKEFNDLFNALSSPTDNKAVKFVQKSMAQCYSSLEPYIKSGTMLFAAIRYGCFSKMAYEFCADKKQNGGTYAYEYMFSQLYAPAKCSAVNFLPKLLPVLKCEIAKLYKRSYDKTKTLRPLDLDAITELSMVLYPSLGLADENGPDFEVLKALLREMDGWERIMDKRAQVLAGVDTCVVHYSNLRYSKAMAVQKTPFRPVLNRDFTLFGEFLECLMVKVSSICGSKTQVFFGLLPSIIPYVPESVVRESVGDETYQLFSDELESLKEKTIAGKC